MDPAELLLKLIRGEAEIDPLSGAVVSATPSPQNPKTQQVLVEVERRKKFDLYQRIVNNKYAPSAARHDHPDEIPPSMQLRRLIDYLIAPVAVYRLFATDLGMLSMVGIDKRLWKHLEEAVPAEVRTRFRDSAQEVTEAIFDDYPFQNVRDEMPEDAFMDRVRICLNDFYGDRQTPLVQQVGSALKLFEADMKTVYVPYAELVLATVFLQEALDQRALHEYALIENKHAKPGTPTSLLAQRNIRLVSEGNGTILIYGQNGSEVQSKGFIEELFMQMKISFYDHDRLVEPMVMRRSVHEAIIKGEQERPAHPGFYQLHFNPPIKLTNV